MELMEALQTRRAIRDFTEEPVDAAVIADLVAAAILAPSAFNLQPWAFAVVNGAARLRELSERARQYQAVHLPAGSPLAGHLADTRFHLLHDAAALVVICATNGESQSAEDCCLAGENLLLAAHAMGLGACWVGLSRSWLELPDVKTELGIPADLNPVAPIVIGHPRTHPGPTPRHEPRIIWCR